MGRLVSIHAPHIELMPVPSVFPATSLRFDHRVNFSAWLHAQKYFSIVPEVRNTNQLRRPLKTREIVDRFLLGGHDICEHLWLWSSGSKLEPEQQRIFTVRFFGEFIEKVFKDIGELPDNLLQILKFLRAFDGRSTTCLESAMRETVSDWIGVCSVYEAANHSTPEEGKTVRVGMLVVPNTIRPKAATLLKRVQNDALHALISTIKLAGPNQANNQYFSLRAMENAKDAIYALGKIYPYTLLVREAFPVTLFIRELSGEWYADFRRANCSRRTIKSNPIPKEEHEQPIQPEHRQNEIYVHSDVRDPEQASEESASILRCLAMARSLGLLRQAMQQKRPVSY